VTALLVDKAKDLGWNRPAIPGAEGSSAGVGLSTRYQAFFLQRGVRRWALVRRPFFE